MERSKVVMGSKIVLKLILGVSLMIALAAGSTPASAKLVFGSEDAAITGNINEINILDVSAAEVLLEAELLASEFEGMTIDIKASTIDESNKDQIYSELHTMRAYLDGTLPFVFGRINENFDLIACGSVPACGGGGGRGGCGNRVCFIDEPGEHDLRVLTELRGK